MDDWSRVFDAALVEVEKFCDDAAKGMMEAVDSFVEFSDGVAEQLQESISPALDQFDQEMGEWFEPFLQAIAGFESAVMDVTQPVSQTVEPLINQHPVCVGCRFYHGQTYGDTMLVCAMHPYGVGEGQDLCPDKEAVSWGFPISNETDEN